MSSAGYHYGTSDGVRTLANDLLRSFKSLMELNKAGMSSIKEMENVDKGGSYARARQMIEDVIKTQANGLDAMAETVTCLRKYADYLESIGR